MSEDRWLDEVLDRTEKEEILDSVKRALDYLEDMDVKKAYNVLELLSHSLDGYDVGKSEFEKNLETSVHKALLEGLDGRSDDPSHPSYLPPEMHRGHSHSFDGTYTTVDPMEDLKISLEEMKQEILRLREEQQYSRDRIREYGSTHDVYAGAVHHPPEREQQVREAVDASARDYIETLMGEFDEQYR